MARQSSFYRRDEIKGLRPTTDEEFQASYDADRRRMGPDCSAEEDMLYHDAVETVDGANTPNRPQARKKPPEDPFIGG